MEKKDRVTLDCRQKPEANCSLTISGTEEEVLEIGEYHVTSKHGIPGLKVALETVGLEGGAPRSPLRPLMDAEAADVRKTLSEAGIDRVR